MEFMESPVARKAVATAMVADVWAGPLRAVLIPQKTKRAGQAVTVYRWLDERGHCCDGLRCGFGAEKMIATAKRNARFSDVVAA